MDSEILAKLEAIEARLSTMESAIRDLQNRTPDIDEDTLVAIAAAVAAYLGVKAKVKAVRYVSKSNSWTLAGRTAVQRRSVPHVR